MRKRWKLPGLLCSTRGRDDRRADLRMCGGQVAHPRFGPGVPGPQEFSADPRSGWSARCATSEEVRQAVPSVCGYDLPAGECRRHHRLKTLTRWRLRQPQPGVLSWTSPAGLTWTSGPEPHVA